jgi:exosortase/archaeosortase family protein
VLLQDNIITTGNGQIAIYEACTSFHNISVAMLCWVTVIKLVRQNWRPSDFAIAGALILITLAMNSLRLFLMANASPNLFDFWHSGIGAGAINAGLSLLVMLIALMAARPAWSGA